ncbi:ThiF family adenylyltransferase [Glutamicibacter sp. MNS18]|nr:ThiF family adenylyltransferase [Glutamicibacter sp. MNS18]MCW4464310.1 ThiF family adenylyltransferase [Glutamicibacter sp. MNS18]
MSGFEPLVPPGEPLDSAELARYSRHLTLPGVGPLGQRRIRNARVLVIGAGGLGSPIINYLVAAGIGSLTVIDDDVVESSNLQRQVIHREADVGRPKAESARDAALRLDANAQVTAITGKLGTDNALELFAGHDLVLDGTDNFATRYLSNDAAELTGTPLVWGTIFRFDGQVSVFAPGRGPMLRDLFPEIPEADSVPSCAEGGVFGTLCAVVGATMAGEALKLICGIGTPLIGRFWRYDALESTTNVLNFAADPAREPVTGLVDYQPGCAVPTPVPEIEAGELAEHMTVIDVRQDWERELGAIPGSLHIPLEQILQCGWDALDVHGVGGEVVIVCKSGVRSQRAARTLLLERPATTVSSLRGGTVEWFARIRGSELVY